MSELFILSLLMLVGAFGYWAMIISAITIPIMLYFGGSTGFGGD